MEEADGRGPNAAPRSSLMDHGAPSCLCVDELYDVLLLA